MDGATDRFADELGTRQTFRDGHGWEESAGYARAVRVGSWIHVSGTTATGPDGTASPVGDVHGQTLAALRRSVEAVTALGGTRSDVVRSRIYLVPGSDWEAAGRAHAEVLGDVAPANTTLYVHSLVGPQFLVEVELDAHCGGTS
ncbi:Rid family hydrolase [Ornithinimicrobium sufpigmenti]|uniref:Rid family hydrolase n=1 Tax=Ornithinimicrobium sufpigmenti TaxID=2508882 RepID=UPI0010369E2A|nr:MULTISPECIES: Rid family hydrolase [unclassified Ornithinimicrobium]